MIQYEVLRENIPYEQLFSLMKESFHEREEQGLDFTVIHFTLENLKKALKGRPVIVAFEEDPQTGERDYLGFQQMIIKGGEAFAGVMAISPKCKRKGIGSKIEMISEQVAVKEGCSYMTSDTSEVATSSVKWHLKNRYFKYKMRSYPSTNYYTVFFRKQLKTHWFWSVKAFRKIYFYFSAFLCRMYRKKDGSLTAIGSIVFKIRNIPI